MPELFFLLLNHCYIFFSQVGSFALPLTIATPILLGTFISECETWHVSTGYTNSYGNASTHVSGHGVLSNTPTTAAPPPASSSPFGLPSYLGWTCDVHGQVHLP
jgi:hypothetical protein